LACCPGELGRPGAGQGRRRWGAPVWRGGHGLPGRPKEEEGKEKEREKEKGEKGKEKRKKKEKENKGRKIEKRFIKSGENSRKIRRRVFADFSGFLGYRHQFRDGGDGEADRPAGPRRCRIPVVVADRNAGAARVGDGPGAGGAGGIHDTRVEGKESTGVSKGG
jgi:hypothetical protein